MKNPRMIFGVLALLAFVAGFWVLVLSPKREEAAELEDERSQLEASVSELEGQVEAAKLTEDDFPRAYKRLVVLGKAVPEDADTPSLLVELNGVGKANKTEFRAIELQAGSGSAPPPPPESGAEAAPEEESGSRDEVPTTEPAQPTEAVAAGLPIGATIGPAGLPVMRYGLEFRGSFFGLTDFFAGVDRLVSSQDGKTRIRGRLLTVDGFVLSADPKRGLPALQANLSVTAFVTPPGQGVALGATPSAPAVPDPAAPTPTSSPSAGP